jgi:hypothetical protein
MSVGELRLIGTNTDPGNTPEVLASGLTIDSYQDIDVARVNPYPKLGDDIELAPGGSLIQDTRLTRVYKIESLPLPFEQATFNILDNIESVMTCKFLLLKNLTYPIKLHEPDYAVQIVSELEIVEGNGTVRITFNAQRRYPLV